MNLFIVFLVTGIWHGANWTFIVWGLWHGGFIIIERALGIKKANENKYAVFRHLYTILVFVIGWTMFRAESVSEGMRFIATMLGMAEPVTIAVTAEYYYTLPNMLQITVAILLATPLAGSIFDKMKNGITLQQNIYDAGIVALLILVMANLAVSTYNPFIYFRF